MPDRFHIKDGYRTNPRPVYFLDDPKGDITFQPDVIPRAEAVADDAGLSRLVDIGCGWADKLALLHDRRPDWDLVGIDYGDNLTHCRDIYPWGSWLEADLETVDHIDAGGAVAVCSDVIEHLADPTAMLAALRWSGAEAVVFSTPERDIQHGPSHRGPSPNVCHIREWNLDELVSYITASGFEVTAAELTRGNDVGPALSTSLVVAVPA
jgi:hypothetical protein